MAEIRATPSTHTPKTLDTVEAIGTAPRNREVEVRIGRSWYPAILNTDAAMDADERLCDQWQATTDRYPRDWCDGCCWESNSAGNMSAQPEAWRERRQHLQEQQP